MLSKDIIWIDPRSIQVREDRQRRDAQEVADLVPSVRERGVLNPVIIDAESFIVAGERRTRASIEAGLSAIPARLVSDLSPLELKIIELEENERRKDLHWRDHVSAIAQIHAAYGELAAAGGLPWSMTKTAEKLFYEASSVQKILRVARDLENPRIKDAPGLNAAYNILARLDERKVGDALASIADVGKSLEAHRATAATGNPATSGEAAASALSAALAAGGMVGAGSGTGNPGGGGKSSSFGAEESILNVDFIEWLASYDGPRFNLIHCDFPYGINAFAGPQSGRDRHAETYDDDPNVYWKLIKAFCAQRDKFISASAHGVFWLSADVDIMSETIEAFAKWAPEIKFLSKPIIWHKSDNVGVLSDPKRGPRHVYEAALLWSRGDRLILRATSDLKSTPTDKAFHPSTKPQPMLEYFFQMFVDEFTEMFDPTCGSGASLRAAEALGAKRVLGLELSPEHCESARSALRQFRAKRKAAG